MSAHQRTHKAALPTAPDRLARLPLRAELYLASHDDDTGQPHIHPNILAVGLAGALLLELWATQRVQIGWRYDVPNGQWTPEPGRLAVADSARGGDTLSAAAAATIGHIQHKVRPAEQLKHWLRHFAAGDPDLYQRVQASMLTAGVLHHTRRRRYGLLRTDTYTPAITAWPIRIRAHVRSVIHGYRHPDQPGRETPDEQCVALCGLINAIGLAGHLYLPDLSTAQARRWLSTVVDGHHHSIREVCDTVDAVRGDLAVAAMR